MVVALSDLLGLASIGCWLGAQFPQVVENIRRQSCEGIALPFLANWLLGDISNLIGCLLTHQLPFQTWLATYFVIVDCLLVAQYFYYKPPTKPIPHHIHSAHIPRRSATVAGTRRLSVERGHSRYRTLSTVAANVAAAAALAAQKEEEALPPGSSRSLRPYPTYGADEATLPSAGLGEEGLDGDDLLGSSFYSEGGRSIGRKRLTWSVERPGSAGRYPPSSASQLLSPEFPPDTPTALQDILDTEEDEASDASHAQRGSRASRRGATMVFLSTWALFGIGSLVNRGVVSTTSSRSVGRMLFPGEAVHSLPAIPRAYTTPVVQVSQVIPKAWHDDMEHPHGTRKLPPEPPHQDPDFERVLGRIFAWLCTTLYLTSRLPQIWKNFVRKSVEGLSMYLFVFAFLGNVFYVASILLSPNTYLPPPQSTEFIRESIPYLLGSGGTLCFDITIVAQSFIYRPKPRRHHAPVRTIDEEEAGLLASADLDPHPPLNAGEAAIVNRGRPGRTRSLGVSPFKSPTAYQLRALVLDYLCHQCFTNTARAFLHDSTVKELDADGDEVVLSTLDASTSSSPSSRDSSEVSHQKIRELILAGRVDDAIRLLNESFPTVLSDHSPIEASPSNEGEDGNFTYESETSMVTPHLFLNLRVQAFIEACRTRPLEIPPEKVSSKLSGVPSSITDITVDIPDDSAQYGDITPTRLASLLRKGQKLYGLAAALPSSKEKDIYKKELVNVGGLLAYPVPEDSPVSKYLSYERREALADQINRAILHRSGQSPISNIELLTRYTTALWQSARSHGVKVRSGVCIPPTPSRTPAPATGTRPEDIANEVGRFLDALLERQNDHKPGGPSL
ncbi:hypothetical protein FA13DRAFT_1623639 [Coprinellus micaceus]|uniref:CTLH domain-containing protein n=1 Tax=Coprinellus micaceus TaxID=71717 RepID=A0A4Y7TR73_COPMI|nr:hypothetical protein FA13DRAFT_1623639 [Coprinellus micaceus]